MDADELRGYIVHSQRLPVSDWREATPDAVVLCYYCDEEITEGNVHIVDNATWCPECYEDSIEEAVKEAARFANENCRIVRPLPKYDPSKEFRCSQLEYELGNRHSYTPNAFECALRHEYTNYDELLRSLSKDSFWDTITYTAISMRIRELLTQSGALDGVRNP